MTCPPVHALEEFIRGEADSLDVARHLETCAKCRKRCKELEANNLLLDQVRDLAPEWRRDSISEAPDLGLDDYTDLSEIYRGGQGIVYRAFHGPTNRTVAIKVLLQGSLATAKERRRFEREIDIVASFHHPNIVTVYDSGCTHDERRFVVMEFIDGIALDQWGRDAPSQAETSSGSLPGDARRGRKLPHQLRHVLENFAQVCDGVSYAHQRGVIHRDLKPSNILVASDGVPRVLDFGLAKVTAESDTLSQATLTQPGHFLGTLAYASPEQVSAGQGEIDVRTDVHALGVILYELLTGHLPYDVSGAVADTVRNIAERDPTPLRSASSSSWFVIDGELETIVLKAISKPKDRRYQTVEHLKNDILAYIAGDAIDAKRDNTWYVLRKTMRRHRVPVGAAGLLFVVLVVFGVSMTALSSALARQRDAAQAAQIRAETEALKAATINEVMERIFTSVQPAVARGRDVSVADVLSASAPWVDRELAKVPEVQAQVRQTIGNTYRSIGDYDNALKEIQTAVSVLEATFGNGDSRTLSAKTQLARVHLVRGELENGEKLARQVLESQLALLGSDDADIIMTQRTLAELLNARG